MRWRRRAPRPGDPLLRQEPPRPAPPPLPSPPLLLSPRTGSARSRPGRRGDRASERAAPAPLPPPLAPPSWIGASRALPPRAPRSPRAAPRRRPGSAPGALRERRRRAGSGGRGPGPGRRRWRGPRGAQRGRDPKPPPGGISDPPRRSRPARRARSAPCRPRRRPAPPPPRERKGRERGEAAPPRRARHAGKRLSRGNGRACAACSRTPPGGGDCRDRVAGHMGTGRGGVCHDRAGAGHSPGPREAAGTGTRAGEGGRDCRERAGAKAQRAPERLLSLRRCLGGWAPWRQGGGSDVCLGRAGPALSAMARAVAEGAARRGPRPGSHRPSPALARRGFPGAGAGVPMETSALLSATVAIAIGAALLVALPGSVALQATVPSCTPRTHRCLPGVADCWERIQSSE